MSNQALKRVLYLAPEVPALSATFVYNEIFALKKEGHFVAVASVHLPAAKVGESVKAELGDVFFLYKQSFMHKLKNFCKGVVRNPINSLTTVFVMLKDFFKLGVITNTALGQFYRFFVSFSLANYITENKIEHIHVHFAHVPTDLAMYASLITGRSFSVMAHANDIFERGYLLDEKISRSKFFATISQYNINYLKQFSNKTEKLKIVHCGVDTNAYGEPSLRAKNGVPIIGFLGRLVEKKGCTYLLDAVSQLKAQGESFRLEIVGDGPLLEELKAQTNKLQLNDIVEFKGSMPNKDVLKWLTSLTGFVLPCVEDSNGDKDGIPVSLMEAMLFGVVVISTNLSGIPELVLDEKTGFIAETGNTDDLTRKIAQLLSLDEIQRKNLLGNALNHVVEEFDLQRNANKLSTYIQQP
ncbi:glycosyltransferase family 4 protein [Aliikangiella marina]|uniref:Glycosyltransferase family 4 protein n=1 Tax=Aliikangiella marina TaxID=1712262 RepID=A0A545TBN0_9GAMM|nr:glycosyltransferase family 4 protein [Aliikangiella marina]TQV74607.1 glycosyltransferase family 4 protein [Aliikangiella marina]